MTCLTSEEFRSRVGLITSFSSASPLAGKLEALMKALDDSAEGGDIASPGDTWPDPYSWSESQGAILNSTECQVRL